MAEVGSRPLNVVCLATYFKGSDFMRECKSRGCHVILVTKEKTLAEDWPRESIDELIAVPNDASPALFIDLAAFISKQKRIDRIVALEEFDVITAALMREHFCLPGLSSSGAKSFRDKLAMAVAASGAGVDIPAFVPLINPKEIREFMTRVPAPWIIKPRSDVSAIGIRKVTEEGEVWSTIDELNARASLHERASYYFLAQFVPGEVFHVDGVVNQGKVTFAGANQYGRPPLEVAHQGGAYISHTIPYGSADEKKLFKANRRIVKALGLKRGATHAEFIKNSEDGRFYFLEIAARVGGAYIAEVLEAASGINLWREWAKNEVTLGDSTCLSRQELTPERFLNEKEEIKLSQARSSGLERRDYAGIILSLARQETPDTSGYSDPEIVYRVKKRHHAGLIVQSDVLDRVKELLNEYARRFAEDFSATLPPLEKAE
jgi:biotin carboxylase